MSWLVTVAFTAELPRPGADAPSASATPCLVVDIPRRSLRLATWNVNSITARLPRLLAWLEQTAPDVVCLQELKCSAATFPTGALADLGYRAAVAAEGRWNGVAVLSRVGLADVTVSLPGAPGYPDATSPVEARAVAATCGGLRVWSVYVPNGREPGHPHYLYKLEWLARLREAVAGEVNDATAGTGGGVAVCGDFNVAPTDADVWDVAAFVGATHITPAERDALAQLRALGLADVVPRALKGPYPFTFWDYRAGMFHKHMGMRIDFLYLTQGLAGGLTDCYVDREARKGPGASDHAPVVADLALR